MTMKSKIRDHWVNRRIPAWVKHRVRRRASANLKMPCEVRVAGVCEDMTGKEVLKTREFHHRRMFLHGGHHTCANLVLACYDCHKWIHHPANKKAAIRCELLIGYHPRSYWRRDQPLE